MGNLQCCGHNGDVGVDGIFTGVVNVAGIVSSCLCVGVLHVLVEAVWVGDRHLVDCLLPVTDSGSFHEPSGRRRGSLSFLGAA